MHAGLLSEGDFGTENLLLALIDRAMDLQATIGCGKASLQRTESSLCSVSMA